MLVDKQRQDNFARLILILIVTLALSQPAEALKGGHSEPLPLWRLHIVSARTGGPDGVRLLDVNGDDLLDVVTAYEGSGDIVIFLHPGTQKLDKPWPFVVVGNVARGEDAFFIDINGDGNMDVFSSHEGDTLALYVHWAPSDPEDYLNSILWVSERIEVADGHGWLFAVPMDVTGDGRIDIVVGSKDDFFNNRNAIGDLAWLETPTEKRDSWLYHPIDHVGWPMSIEPIDLDQDGDLDILVADRKADAEHQGLRWLENPGQDWTQEWTSHYVADLAGTRPTFLSIGDMNGDGAKDIIVPLEIRGEIAIISLEEALSEQTPGKAIAISIDLSPDEASFKAVGAADIDLDGDLEIVASTEGGSLGLGYFDRVAGSLSNSWTWVPIFDALSNPKYDLIAFYDVDGDGDLDFLTTEERQGLGVIWLENPAISAE